MPHALHSVLRNDGLRQYSNEPVDVVFFSFIKYFIAIQHSDKKKKYMEDKIFVFVTTEIHKKI